MNIASRWLWWPILNNVVMMMIFRLERGFTLIEMMVVVAILGLLAAFAFPLYLNYVKNTRLDNARAAMLLSAQNMARFYSQNVCYPAPAASAAGATTAQGACFVGANNNTIITNNNAFFSFANELPNICDTTASSSYTSENFCLTARPTNANSNETRFLKMNETGVIQVCTGTGAGSNCTAY